MTAGVTKSSPLGWAGGLSSLPCAIPTQGRNSTDISSGPINSPKRRAWGRAVGAALQPRKAEAPQPHSSDAAPNAGPNPKPLGSQPPPYVRVSGGLPAPSGHPRRSTEPRVTPRPCSAPLSPAPGPTGGHSRALLRSPRPGRGVKPPAPLGGATNGSRSGPGRSKAPRRSGEGVNGTPLPKGFLGRAGR